MDEPQIISYNSVSFVLLGLEQKALQDRKCQEKYMRHLPNRERGRCPRGRTSEKIQRDSETERRHRDLD